MLAEELKYRQWRVGQCCSSFGCYWGKAVADPDKYSETASARDATLEFELSNPSLLVRMRHNTMIAKIKLRTPRAKMSATGIQKGLS